MRWRIAVYVLVVSAVLVAGTRRGALQAAKPVPDVALTVDFRDDPGDGIRSDGRLSLSGAPFQYVNGQPDNVGTILRGGINFYFVAQDASSVPIRRNICLNFGAQAPPWGASTQCVPANQNMDPPFEDINNFTPLTTLRYGQFMKKRLQFWWDDVAAGYRYHLRFGGNLNGDLISDSPPVTVTCVAPTTPSLPCTTWTVINDGFVIAGRSRVVRGKLGAFEFLGFYDLPFEETLTKH